MVAAGRRRAVWMGALVTSMATAWAGPASVDRLSLDTQPERLSLALAAPDNTQYRVFTLQSPDRVVVDVLAARLGPGVLPLPPGAGGVRQVRVANRPDGSVRVVLDMIRPVNPTAVLRREAGALQLSVTLGDGDGVGVESVPAVAAVVPAGPTPAAPPVAAEPAAVAPAAPEVAAAPVPQSRAASPTGRDIVIAVDAGHGGKDPGAHGPRGVLEKDVTLRIARALVTAINAEPGMRGMLTRDRDEFIPLRGRMERARAAKADLFISVHADAVRNRQVRGASVYVLNEKGATDEAARRLAARENAADLIGGVSLRTKDRTLASVLLDLSQNASLSSSIEVADSILDELARVGTVRKPQVMQAPFMVLKSPDVPSVLVETAYISNPDEERQLDSAGHRERLAGAIFAGVKDYFYRNPPQGSLVAELGRRRLADGRSHVIAPGESLSAIAVRYNVSVGRLRDANQLKSDSLVVGQSLRIPGPTET